MYKTQTTMCFVIFPTFFPLRKDIFFSKNSKRRNYKSLCFLTPYDKYMKSKNTQSREQEICKKHIIDQASKKNRKQCRISKGMILNSQNWIQRFSKKQPKFKFMYTLACNIEIKKYVIKIQSRHLTLDDMLDNRIERRENRIFFRQNLSKFNN